MRALTSHRKWNGGADGGPPKAWEEVQDDLRAQKALAPKQAAYCLAADPMRPGAFYLGHLIGSTPRREYFVVVPDGFYFRKRTFGTVEHMLVQFKKDPRGQPKQAYAPPEEYYGSQPPPPQAYPYA